MKQKGKRSYKSAVNVEDKAFTQRGRITSIHGVMLPPKKKRIDTKYLTLRFVVVGTIPSKKNRQRARSNFWAVRIGINKIKTPMIPAVITRQIDSRLKLYIQTAPEHQEWVKTTIPLVEAQRDFWQAKYAPFGVVFPLNDVSVKVYHYWADKRERDLSNKFETISDMLVAAKVIWDDSWQVMNCISSEGENYSGQIKDHITVIDVSVRLKKGVT